MKVLKHGIIPAPITYTGTCRRCKCEFEVGSGELTMVPLKWFGFKTDRQEEGVCCPTCDEPISAFSLREKGDS